MFADTSERLRRGDEALRKQQLAVSVRAGFAFPLPESAQS